MSKEEKENKNANGCNVHLLCVSQFYRWRTPCVCVCVQFVGGTWSRQGQPEFEDMEELSWTSKMIVDAFVTCSDNWFKYTHLLYSTLTLTHIHRADAQLAVFTLLILPSSCHYLYMNERGGEEIGSYEFVYSRMSNRQINCSRERLYRIEFWSIICQHTVVCSYSNLSFLSISCNGDELNFPPFHLFSVVPYVLFAFPTCCSTFIYCFHLACTHTVHILKQRLNFSLLLFQCTS